MTPIQFNNINLTQEALYHSGNATLTASELTKCSSFFNNMVCSQDYFIILVGFGFLVVILSFILHFVKKLNSTGQEIKIKQILAMLNAAYMSALLFFGVTMLKYLKIFNGSFSKIKFFLYFIVGFMIMLIWKYRDKLKIIDDK
jgi:hypothetical protein